MSARGLLNKSSKSKSNKSIRINKTRVRIGEEDRLTKFVKRLQNIDYERIFKAENFFFGHASGLKKHWDFLIMIFACWNVFMLPI